MLNLYCTPFYFRETKLFLEKIKSVQKSYASIVWIVLFHFYPSFQFTSCTMLIVYGIFIIFRQ